MSFFQKLKESISVKTESVTRQFKTGLSKTKSAFVDKMEALFIRSKRIDEDFYEELEEILISADVGVATTMKLIEDLYSHSCRCDS